MQKNIAGQKWIVFAFNKITGDAVTGDAANITANLRLDGGVANPIDDTNPAELEGGYYAFDLTDVETNGDLIVICPSSVTANVAVIGIPGAVWTEPTGGVAAAVNLATVDGIVDAIKLKTDTINDAGALVWTYTLTDSVTGAAIADATIIITSDSAGAVVLRTGVTNSAGVATFYFSPADSGTTVYVWRSHAGYNFTNPDSEVIS
jgi:hypothetical protein